MSSNYCYTCKHWCGNKYSGWGDCQYIVADLIPELTDEINLFGWKFKVPFDPHDIKYFDDRSVLNQLGKIKLPEGVLRYTRREQDIKFILSQWDGTIIGERTAPIKLVYFQTATLRKGCDYYVQR